MKDKKKEKFDSAKLDKPLSKENAKLSYEKLADEKESESKEKFEDLIERKIQKAMADGKFDNLEGKGKPLNLKKYYKQIRIWIIYLAGWLRIALKCCRP